MASPPGSRSSSNAPILLPLVKFSYAKGPMNVDSSAPVHWTHLTSKNNLFAIFQTTRSRNIDGSLEERTKLKVLQDPEVMVKYHYTTVQVVIVSCFLGRT